MSAPAKKTTPKIGEIYITRGRCTFKLLKEQTSFVIPGVKVMLLAEEVELPQDSALLLMDQLTLKDVVPHMRTNGIVYKFLSLERRQIVYYVSDAVIGRSHLTAQDYKLAIHEFYHILSPLPSA